MGLKTGGRGKKNSSGTVKSGYPFFARQIDGTTQEIGVSQIFPHKSTYSCIHSEWSPRLSDSALPKQMGYSNSA